MKRHYSKRESPSIVSRRKRVKPFGENWNGVNDIQWRIYIDGLNGEQRSKLFRLIDRQNLVCEILAYRPSASGKDVASVIRVIGDCHLTDDGIPAGGMVILARFLDSTQAVAEPYSEMKLARNFDDGNCEMSAAGSGELTSGQKRFRALNKVQRLKTGPTIAADYGREQKRMMKARDKRAAIRRIIDQRTARPESLERDLALQGALKGKLASRAQQCAYARYCVESLHSSY